MTNSIGDKETGSSSDGGSGWIGSGCNGNEITNRDISGSCGGIEVASCLS